MAGSSPWPILCSVLEALEPKWQNYPAVIRVMRNTFIDNLTRAIQFHDQLPYVITGDIPAMWLRDSSGQLEPYIRFTQDDHGLRQLIAGTIRRQADYIVADPYANAFNASANGHMGIFWDRTTHNPWVYERKFSLDSLAYPVRMWWLFWKQTGDAELIRDCLPAIQSIVNVFEVEQHHQELSRYRFQRWFGGRRNRLAVSEALESGLIWSGFRPSDDANQLPYNIPGQMMAAVALDMIAEWCSVIFDEPRLAARARAVRSQVIAAVSLHGLVEDRQPAPFWAYEVDALGHWLEMDDANIPSLLSAPFLYFCSQQHPIYRTTRERILSSQNPYWSQGRMFAGVGSGHTRKGRVWPMAIIMDALTESDRASAQRHLDQVARADAGTGWIHESVDPNYPQHYSRAWFGWVNALFAEAVLRLSDWPAVDRSPLI